MSGLETTIVLLLIAAGLGIAQLVRWWLRQVDGDAGYNGPPKPPPAVHSVCLWCGEFTTVRPIGMKREMVCYDCAGNKRDLESLKRGF